jgi:TatD DNase family protein
MFDAHTHLQDERLAGCRAAVLAAAAAADVTDACCCGSAPDDWRGVAQLAAAPCPLRLWPAFGVHPWYVGGLPRDWRDLLEDFLVAHPAAAVGEIGMDGLRKEVPKDWQREVFTAQLALATRHGRTVVLHGARAWGALIEALQPHAAALPSLVVHAFAGSRDSLRALLALGAYISFVGTLCNPAAARVRAAAAVTPAARLLVETDSPDLLPRDGVAAGDEPAARLNQPANLTLVVRALAAIRGAGQAETAALTAANARRAFCCQP